MTAAAGATALCLQIVSITSSQLSDWASAGSFDLAKDTKDLSFEFSTQLLVSTSDRLKAG